MLNDCPFCEYEGPSRIIEDGGDTFVIKPVDPVTDGHVLVIPRVHVIDFTDDLNVTVAVMRHAALFARMRYGDSNLITSRGRWATQTVKHLHVHLIPRRPNDGLKLPWTDPAATGGTYICVKDAPLGTRCDDPEYFRRAGDHS